MNSIEFSSMATMMPSISNISKDIIVQNDTDSDTSLSIEELGVDEEVFNSLDSDGDGLVTQDEIATAIDSAMSQFGGEMPSKEDFSSMLSDLGLELPAPPEKPDASSLVSELIASYDSDGDGALSAQEVSLLTEEEFSSIDTDSDGSITTEELTTAVESTGGGAAPASGGGGAVAASSEEETYDEMDTNEDGVVSQAEEEAYNKSMGISSDTTSETSSEEDILAEQNQNALDNIKLLFEALQLNSEDDQAPDMSSFKNIMSIINTQNNNSDLNTYLENATNSTLSSSYA